MKKFNYKILPLSFLLVLFSACSSERLDVDPVNEFLSANFYSTEAQIYSALIAAYDPMGWTMAYGQWISGVMFGDIRSDNANAGGDSSDNDQPGWQELDDFRDLNTTTVIQPLYRRNYIGIFRANLVINNAKIESPLVDLYQAEAKFLRAYYHFELFKHFGPIPVVMEPLAPDENDRARNTMSEVFDAIVTDLTQAIDEIPMTVPAEQAGRINQGMAKALLAKAYIYWADLSDDDPQKFDMAAMHLQDIVDSGVYDLVDDMRDLYLFGQKNTVEAVFEIQQSNKYPSDWGWFEGIDGNGIVQLCGVRGLCESHPTIQAGWGFLLPTQELYDFYLDDDAYRRGTSILSVADLEQTIADSSITDCPVVVDITQGNPADYTGLWQNKFSNFKAYKGNNINGGDPNLTKDANIPVIRYSEVLLLLAEALHRGSGGDGAAMSYIDQVRERAYGPGDNEGLYRTAQQLMSDEGWSLLDVIWYERRAELAMEGDRWYDLVRSGRASASLFAGDPIRGSNFEEKNLWLPISLEELSVTLNLTEYPEASLFQ